VNVGDAAEPRKSSPTIITPKDEAGGRPRRTSKIVRHHMAIEEALSNLMLQTTYALDALVAWTVEKRYAKSEPSALEGTLMIILNHITHARRRTHGAPLRDPRHIASMAVVNRAKDLFSQPVRTSTESIIRRAREIIAFGGVLHHVLHAGTSQATRDRLVSAWQSGDVAGILRYCKGPTEAKLSTGVTEHTKPMSPTELPIEATPDTPDEVDRAVAALRRSDTEAAEQEAAGG